MRGRFDYGYSGTSRIRTPRNGSHAEENVTDTVQRINAKLQYLSSPSITAPHHQLPYANYSVDGPNVLYEQYTDSAEEDGTYEDEYGEVENDEESYFDDEEEDYFDGKDDYDESSSYDDFDTEVRHKSEASSEKHNAVSMNGRKMWLQALEARLLNYFSSKLLIFSLLQNIVQLWLKYARRVAFLTWSRMVFHGQWLHFRHIHDWTHSQEDDEVRKRQDQARIQTLEEEVIKLSARGESDRKHEDEIRQLQDQVSQLEVAREEVNQNNAKTVTRLQDHVCQLEARAEIYSSDLEVKKLS